MGALERLTQVDDNYSNAGSQNQANFAADDYRFAFYAGNYDETYFDPTDST